MNRFSISSPTDSPLGNLEYSRPRRNSQSSSSSLSLYYRRIVNKQLDFEVALYSFFYLIVNPSRVYRNAYHQKQTKSRWARDDPSFYLLLAACMIVTAICYGLAFESSVLGTVKLVFFTVAVEFLVCGSLVASLTWFCTNKFMVEGLTLQSVDHGVEYLYCFDVHCNAFVPFFLITYLVQFFFLTIVTRDGFLPCIVSNTIYLIACNYYCYVTFLGFNALPFIKNAVIFLYPAVASVFAWAMSLLLGLNISQFIFSLYFVE